MKKVWVFIVFLFLIFSIHGKKIAKLEELIKPDIMFMGNGRMYITEGASIFIYSLKDYKLIKKFGKEGEGPKEFKISPFGAPMLVYPFEDKIFINSNAKISYFTQDGEFIKEVRIPPLLTFRKLQMAKPPHRRTTSKRW